MCDALGYFPFCSIYFFKGNCWLWPTKFISQLSNGSPCTWWKMGSEIIAAQNNSKHRPSGPVLTSPFRLLEELADDGSSSHVVYWWCSAFFVESPFRDPVGCVIKWPWSQMLSHTVEGDLKSLKYPRHQEKDVRSVSGATGVSISALLMRLLSEAKLSGWAGLTSGSPVGLWIPEGGRARQELPMQHHEGDIWPARGWMIGVELYFPLDFSPELGVSENRTRRNSYIKIPASKPGI